MHRSPDPRADTGARATALHGAPYHFAVRGDDWVMVTAGEAIETITGYPASDFIENRRRNYQSLLHPDDLEVVSEIVADAVARGEAYSLEYRIQHADGSTRWVQGHGRGVF